MQKLTHISALQGLSKKHDISSEDNEIVKAGKEHLIQCLEVKSLANHSCVQPETPISTVTGSARLAMHEFHRR